MKTNFHWTADSEASLRNLWLHSPLSASAIGRKFGITRNAVIGKANRLGLKRGHEDLWSAAEDAALIAAYKAREPVRAVASRIGRSKQACYNRAYELRSAGYRLPHNQGALAWRPHPAGEHEGRETMPRSPIEMMIDKACGIAPGEQFSAPPMVRLRCPRCHGEKSARKEEADPTATAVVVFACPKCCGSGDFEEITYLDSDGRELAPA